MRNLNFLVIGKNQEILEVLKRIIENNKNWYATILSNEEESYAFIEANKVDIVLLSSGLEDLFEKNIKDYISKKHTFIKVIVHYGGGSGLLMNEVYSEFPELNS